MSGKAKDGKKMKRAAAKRTVSGNVDAAALGRVDKAKANRCEVAKIFGPTEVLDKNGKVIPREKWPKKFVSPSY